MKYILTEKQIEKLVYDVGIQPGSYGIILDDFLKSKSPVEEVQEITFALNDGVLKNKTLKMYIEVIK